MFGLSIFPISSINVLVTPWELLENILLDTLSHYSPVHRCPLYPCICFLGTLFIGDARFITVFKKKSKTPGGDRSELPPILCLGEARDEALLAYFSRYEPTERELETVMAAAAGPGMNAAADLVTQKRHKVREGKVDSAHGFIQDILCRRFLGRGRICILSVNRGQYCICILPWQPKMFVLGQTKLLLL